MAAYLFHQGTNFHAYEYLGMHIEGDGIVFRVWAPNADYVSVCGDFNFWNRESDSMTRITEGGVWELKIPTARIEMGQCYKYCIRNKGKELLKADPYGFSMQRPPETASLICDISGYTWRDEGWMNYRKETFNRANYLAQPINVYEVHLGSWKKHEDGSYIPMPSLQATSRPTSSKWGTPTWN